MKAVCFLQSFYNKCVNKKDCLGHRSKYLSYKLGLFQRTTGMPFSSCAELAFHHSIKKSVRTRVMGVLDQISASN